MMNRNARWLAVLVLSLVVAGCGAAPSLMQLQGTLTSVDPVGGSAEEYGVQRARIVAEMKTALRESRGMETSKASRIKKIVAGAGAVIALGSTVGSLVVDDTDTQSTIAQAGAGVAGAAGVAALLP
ncbi:MAG: hypothetical protein HKN12_06520, partial [Gemmatimonadetes bacterium]|nr:hypothetical protein [Gemmatimonadota bacterium]